MFCRLTFFGKEAPNNSRLRLVIANRWWYHITYPVDGGGFQTPLTNLIQFVFSSFFLYLFEFYSLRYVSWKNSFCMFIHYYIFILSYHAIYTNISRLLGFQANHSNVYNKNIQFFFVAVAVVRNIRKRDAAIHVMFYAIM